MHNQVLHNAGVLRSAMRVGVLLFFEGEIVFLYILAAGLMSGHNLNQSNDALYAAGYFLCGFAVLVSIGILVITIKFKRINEIHYKNKKNSHL